MKGIILAGGEGSRLYPITLGTSKQLLPVYDKPMIYYPLSVLMLSNIREILIISTPKDLNDFQRLLGDGSGLGLSLSYATQNKPNGIAEAFIIAENFIKDSNICLVLGDNIFYGQNFRDVLIKATEKKNGATIFCYHVNDPSRFGVVEFDSKNKVLSIEEKPKKAKSNFVITGLYFYDNDVVNIAKSLKPSERNELEITDVNKHYLNLDNLYVENLGRGFAWLDTGTHEDLLAASHFVQTIEQRQGLKIACIEEIAYHNGWIDHNQITKLSQKFKNNNYGKYLQSIVNDN